MRLFVPGREQAEMTQQESGKQRREWKPIVNSKLVKKCCKKALKAYGLKDI